MFAIPHISDHTTWPQCAPRTVETKRRRHRNRAISLIIPAGHYLMAKAGSLPEWRRKPSPFLQEISENLGDQARE